jgi:hypothetical protein
MKSEIHHRGAGTRRNLKRLAKDMRGSAQAEQRNSRGIKALFSDLRKSAASLLPAPLRGELIL